MPTYVVRDGKAIRRVPPVSRDNLWVSYYCRNNPPVPGLNRIKEEQAASLSTWTKNPNLGLRLCQMDQTLVNCFFDRGGTPGNGKFLKQTLDVGLHRPFGNPKFVPDGLIAVAFSYEA